VTSTTTILPNRKIGPFQLFLFHLLVVYLVPNIGAPLLLKLTEYALRMIGAGHPQGQYDEFWMNYFFIFCVISALTSAIFGKKFWHSAAWFVWLVPVAILIGRIIISPTSRADDPLAEVYHWFFEGNFHFIITPGMSSLDMLYPNGREFLRALEQTSYTAPAISGVVYSLVVTLLWMRQKRSEVSS